MFVFEKQFQGSYNINLLVHEEHDPSLKWVAKISRMLGPWADFRDLDERALLAYRLAKLVGLKTIDTEVTDLENITGFDAKSVTDKISDKAFLTRYGGINLLEFLGTNTLEDIKNKEELFFSFVFNLWIGNYDKKAGDYLINESKEVLSIDYQLCGPGFKASPDLALGAYAESYDLNEVSDTGWCLDGNLDNNMVGPIMSYVRNLQPTIFSFISSIKAIESVPEKDIAKSMDGLNFYSQIDEHGSRTQINALFKDFIIKRQGQLETAVNNWIINNYPISHRPKREHG